MSARAIDTWVNVNMEELGRPDYLVEVASKYFKQGEDFFRNYEVDEMVALMDGLGVERCILTTDPKHPSVATLTAGFLPAAPLPPSPRPCP